MCCLSVGEKVVLLQMIMFFSMGARLSFSMYKRLMFICAVSVFVQLTGCKKGDDGMRFSIFTEPFNGGVKVEVNGLESSWRTGDQVWVNGQTGAVSVSDNNSPTLNVSVASWNGHYYAAYPASVVMNGNQNGELTISLPQIYQYDEDESTHRQLLELPMVATTTNDQIAFRHLTGALVVKVPKTDRNIVLDYVMVQSSTTALSGTGTVNMNRDADSPQVTFGADTTHTVIMFFDEHPVTILSNASTTKDIMIPIAPTSGEDHQFTVTVRAHTRNSTYKYYLFNRKSSVGNMARNEVGVAPVPSLPEGHFVGQGTQTNPYLIQNKEDYKHFIHCVCTNELNDGKYKLVYDIDFYGDTITLEASSSGVGKFYGTFNGNGKELKNASVQGVTNAGHHYLSLFPALSGGVVNDLSVSDVNLIAPQGNSLSYVYAGGFTSLVESYDDGVSIQNVRVSNVSFSYPSTSPKVSYVFMGGIVGKVEKNGASRTGRLTMTSCRYEQLTARDYSVSSQATTVYWGGLVGAAASVDVFLTNCQVGFGGNQQTTGTTVNSSASSLNYVGGAIGKSTNNTIQISTSLLLEGHIQFIGRNDNSVKKVVGSASTVSGNNLVDKPNLYFWMRTNAGSENTVAPD